MPDSRDVSPRDAARAYARAGIAVLPLHYITRARVCSCGHDDCKNPGKHPWTRHGVDDATTNDRRICDWWDDDPSLNVGIAPDVRDDCVWIVVDLDKGERIRNRQRVYLDGPADLRALEDDFNEDVKQRVVQRSGSGAKHIILKIPRDARPPSFLSKAIEIIKPGKYIVAAPSNHISGGVYEWLNPPAPGGTVFDRIGEIFDQAPFAPDWLLDYDPHGRSRSRQDDDERGADLLRMMKKTDLEPEEFADATMSIPNKGMDVPYDVYLNVLFSIHFEFDGDNFGYDLAHEWAEQSDKYNPDDVDHRWDSIYNNKGSSKTGKYILMLARENGWEPPPKKDWEKAIRRLNLDHALVKVGSDARILKEYRKNGRIDHVIYMKTSTFGDVFLPEKYMFPAPIVTDPSREKPTSIAPIWMNSKKRREFEQLVFDPRPQQRKPDVEGLPDYNLYRGFAIAPATLARPASGCSLLLKHIYDNIADGNEAWGDWIIAWLAQQIQEPWNKLGTCLVLIGKEGVGKSILGLVMKRILGTHHVTASDAHSILSNFNSSLATAMFVQMEEAFWAGDKRAQGALFHLITGETIRLEPKGVDATEIQNYARIMITTNSDWAVPAGLDARRFGVFRVGDAHMQDRPYFARLVGQLEDGGYEAFLQYLMAYDWKRENPAVPPTTPALIEQKHATMGAIEQFVLELLDEDESMIWRDDDENGEIEATELFRRADRFHKSRNQRYPGDSNFSQRLKRILPGLRVFKPHGKPRRYEFPPRAECRGVLAATIGEISED